MGHYNPWFLFLATYLSECAVYHPYCHNDTDIRFDIFEFTSFENQRIFSEKRIGEITNKSSFSNLYNEGKKGRKEQEALVRA